MEVHTLHISLASEDCALPCIWGCCFETVLTQNGEEWFCNKRAEKSNWRELIKPVKASCRRVHSNLLGNVTRQFTLLHKPGTFLQWLMVSSLLSFASDGYNCSHTLRPTMALCCCCSKYCQTSSTWAGLTVLVMLLSVLNNGSSCHQCSEDAHYLPSMSHYARSQCPVLSTWQMLKKHCIPQTASTHLS